MNNNVIISITAMALFSPPIYSFQSVEDYYHFARAEALRVHHAVALSKQNGDTPQETVKGLTKLQITTIVADDIIDDKPGIIVRALYDSQSEEAAIVIRASLMEAICNSTISILTSGISQCFTNISTPSDIVAAFDELAQSPNNALSQKDIVRRYSTYRGHVALCAAECIRRANTDPAKMHGFMTVIASPERDTLTRYFADAPQPPTCYFSVPKAPPHA